MTESAASLALKAEVRSGSLKNIYPERRGRLPTQQAPPCVAGHRSAGRVTWHLHVARREARRRRGRARAGAGTPRGYHRLSLNSCRLMMLLWLIRAKFAASMARSPNGAVSPSVLPLVRGYLSGYGVRSRGRFIT